jgi:hypothetical protein
MTFVDDYSYNSWLRKRIYLEHWFKIQNVRKFGYETYILRSTSWFLNDLVFILIPIQYKAY